MEQLRKVCSNPWCKATFLFTQDDMIMVKDDYGKETQEEPKFCKKCQSFDKELSGGVEWKDREYTDDEFGDGLPHQIKYKITRYK